MSRYLGNYEKAKSRNRGQKKVKNSIPKTRKTFQGDNCKNIVKPGGEMPVRIQEAFKIPDRQEQKKIPPVA